MPVTDSFVAFVLEQLDPIGPTGPIMTTRMFGGVGLYAGDRFFGLIADDVLYLKCDAATRLTLETAGGRPLQARRTRLAGTTKYYSVPVSILESSETLLALVKRTLA